jgi:hypothetical protein
MSTVNLTITGSTLSVASPFHPEFPAAARNLGGKWHAASKTWRFDARDETRVRALCLETFGTDGSPVGAADLVTVRVTIASGDYIAADKSSIFLCGREVARAYGRDSGAKLGAGVVVLSGGFTSGGSVKNWETRSLKSEQTIFEIRDVPRLAAQRLVDKEEGWYSGMATVEIVTEDDHDNGNNNRRAALETERAVLLARLAEIDAALGLAATPPVQPSMLTLFAALTRAVVHPLALRLQTAARAMLFPGQLELAL